VRKKHNFTETNVHVLAVFTIIMVVTGCNRCGSRTLPPAPDAGAPDTMVVIQDGSLPLQDDAGLPDVQSNLDITPTPDMTPTPDLMPTPDLTPPPDLAPKPDMPATTMVDCPNAKVVKTWNLGKVKDTQVWANPHNLKGNFLITRKLSNQKTGKLDKNDSAQIWSRDGLPYGTLLLKDPTNERTHFGVSTLTNQWMTLTGTHVVDYTVHSFDHKSSTTNVATIKNAGIWNEWPRPAKNTPQGVLMATSQMDAKTKVNQVVVHKFTSKGLVKHQQFKAAFNEHCSLVTAINADSDWTVVATTGVGSINKNQVISVMHFRYKNGARQSLALSSYPHDYQKLGCPTKGYETWIHNIWKTKTGFAIRLQESKAAGQPSSKTWIIPFYQNSPGNWIDKASDWVLVPYNLHIDSMLPADNSGKTFLAVNNNYTAYGNVSLLWLDVVPPKIKVKKTLNLGKCGGWTPGAINDCGMDYPWIAKTGNRIAVTWGDKNFKGSLAFLKCIP